MQRLEVIPGPVAAEISVRPDPRLVADHPVVQGGVPYLAKSRVLYLRIMADIAIAKLAY